MSVDEELINKLSIDGIAVDSVLNSNTFANYGLQPLIIGKWLEMDNVEI